MDQTAAMHLKILLPFGVFREETEVSSIVAETGAGSIGILPRRRDCVTSLVPGIFIYETQTARELFIAVDEGVMIKKGTEVLVSVRNAIAGKDLARLHQAVEEDFLSLNEHQRDIRFALAKLESGFIRRIVEFQHG